jgi:hypothetical protein
MHTVTTVFPSVTGPAYTPFLLGRYPGPIGLPGLRWFDRSREVVRTPGSSRSYVGYEMGNVDTDLAADAPTLFELSGSGLGALNMINRGLSIENRVGKGLPFIVRTGITHFRGNLDGWLAIDRDVANETALKIRQRRPAAAFIALTGIDKSSHATGHESATVLSAMRIVDETVAMIRADAERDGRWDEMHLWVVSDHGHSPVRTHEDLAGLLEDWKLRPISHPWVFRHKPATAVMVSGNAMAHIYVDIAGRQRKWWPERRGEWGALARDLLERESVDLLMLPSSPRSCEIRSALRGSANLEWSENRSGTRYTYRHLTGNPLGIAEQFDIADEEAYDVTLESDYPDGLVQIAALSGSPRSGDIILSAAREWDFRAKYEPIPHVSSHGALHREHMLVPLLLSRPAVHRPRRTVDLMPSALTALRLPIPDGLDGKSFL